MFPLPTLKGVLLYIFHVFAFRTELLNADEIWYVYRGLLKW